MNIKTGMIKTILKTAGLINYKKYKYSQEYEDNFKYMDWREKLWWGYKFFIKQPDMGERGKNIEKYFLYQNLNYNPPKDFAKKSSLFLTAAGDLNASAHIRPDNTKNMWEDIGDFYFSGDIVVANLEALVTPKHSSKGVPTEFTAPPTINTSPEMFERFCLNGKGINFFSTANNHCLDQGEEGLIANIDFLDFKGYAHVGTSRSKEEQDNIPIIEKNGIKIAFLSYTYSLNGRETTKGKEYLTNYIRLNKTDTDIEIIREHAASARKKGADIVVAVLHWSIEYETYPIQNVIDMGHKIMECGIDVILGGHPHVAQPMEKYEFKDPFTGEVKNGFIIYSLGDFVAYHKYTKNTKLSWIIGLEISKGILKEKQVTLLTGLKVLPIYIYTGFQNNYCNTFKFLRFEKLLKQLESGENLYDFDHKEIEELKRLKKHLYKCLLPKEHGNLLVK
ncbi:CapA family protein [Clostridium sp. JS66]|uniref:CapA family protein n=1 Tax=Clostridium sp. JS66 TaxID=3064705 RepID=UPI00298E0EBE|nr:CapA family protein [Clostridium sp. JS66]WPC39711.1 CapA family protein [Clostridium sp. JS66]